MNNIQEGAEQPAKEIITISIGQIATFEATHFYNILNQQQQNTYFSETLSSKRPRSIFINYQSALSPTYYDVNEDDDKIEHLNDKMEAKQFIKKQIEKHQFQYRNQVSIDAQSDLFDLWCQDQSTQATIEKPLESFVFDRQYYTDFQEFNIDNQIYTFNNSTQDSNYNFVKIYSNDQLNDISDMIQTQLERCDYFQGFNMFSDGTNLACLASDVINEIQTLTGKRPIFNNVVNCFINQKNNMQIVLQQLNTLLNQQQCDDFTHQLYLDSQKFCQLQNYQNLYKHSGIQALGFQNLQNNLVQNNLTLDYIQRKLTLQSKMIYTSSLINIQDIKSMKNNKYLYYGNNYLTQQELSQMQQQSVSGVNIIYGASKSLGQHSTKQQNQINIYNTQYSQLSDTFPQIFDVNQIKYRTKTHVQTSLLNNGQYASSYYNNVYKSLNQLKTKAAVVNYFRQADIDAEEVFDYCKNVQIAYKKHESGYNYDEESS